MHRDSRLYLDDILEAIDRIRDYILGLDYKAFQQDRKTQDAVVRNLEIIGEAAGHLPKSLHTAAPEIEWRKIKRVVVGEMCPNPFSIYQEY